MRDNYEHSAIKHAGKVGMLILILVGFFLSPVWSQDRAKDRGGGVTPSSTAGPYYRSGSPERSSLVERGIPGQRVIVTGVVFDRDCEPVGGVWIDFWQADGRGRYDNSGYRLRGHQYTDSSGRFRLETVLPAAYGSRPPHIHVKLRAPGGSNLTTQLYFPGEKKNRTDWIFNQKLLITWADESKKQAIFNFVLESK
jgi:protocatechuate 3,4-dioxygenase beta subunit